MFCQQCGNQIGEGVIFCPNCGARQEKVNPNAAQQQYNQQNGQYAQQQYNQQNGQYAQQQYNWQDGQYAQQQYNQQNRQYSQQQYNQQGYAGGGYAQPNIYAGQNSSGSPKNVSFGEAIKLYFVNYVNFEGRSTAGEYWWIVLCNVILSSFFRVLSEIPMFYIISAIVSLGLLLPSLALSVRRLHDTGKSWVYLLMGLIPLAGIIILIIQFSKKSDGDNKWGPAPRN